MLMHDVIIRWEIRNLNFKEGNKTQSLDNLTDFQTKRRLRTSHSHQPLLFIFQWPQQMTFPEMFLLWFWKKVQKPKSCEWWLSKVNRHANECEDRTGYAFGVQEQIMRFGLRKRVAPWFMPRTWLRKVFLLLSLRTHPKSIKKKNYSYTALRGFIT